ncbi:pseudouridine synthase [Blattabacterium cuenoti]|uniref:pseudouridine synthase n=1 Tax=Blattabacterium cuenoti TaxID=1653831 RepID=UPI00163CAB6D|nr:pseudouridine synthase [Blattabacterium cuenoti]
MIKDKKKDYIRLNRYLSNAGISSRREADKLIQSGVIEVNGKSIYQLGTIVHKNDIIKYHGRKIKHQKKIYLLLNKPKGFITSTKDPLNRKTVMNLIPKFSNYRIYPIGRLDRLTTGVLLFTNDGLITEKLTHPKYHVKKIYHVFLNKNLEYEDINKIKKGKIYLKEGKVKVDFIYKSKNKIIIGLHLGWNRIIKRLFKKLTYQVIKIDRVNFGGFTKKNIPIGNWCFLNEKEVYHKLINHFL